MSAVLTKVLRRCKKDPAFFIDSFIKILHPSLGIIPFRLFKYQRRALKTYTGNRFCVWRKCRQSGISTLTGVYALWMAMFQRNKTILVVSRSDEAAKDFLLRNIKTPYRQLPQFLQDLWPIEENEHRVFFPSTNSVIKSKTSAPDVLRSESASLNIIDEAGFIPKMGEMWTAGWPCTRFDTLIQTDRGLVKIGELGDHEGEEWQDVDVKVATDEGWQQSTRYHLAGKNAPTKILTTQLGFEFESTAHHRIRVIDSDGDYVWREVGSVSTEDLIVSKPNQFYGVRQYLDGGVELTPEIAEIIGLYIGDGSIRHERPKRLRINFDPQDVVTRDLMVEKFNLVFSWLPTSSYGESNETTEDLRINSSELSEWWRKSGLDSKSRAWDAEIPNQILKSDREVVYGFLRGLFDSDGWAYWSGDKLNIGISSTSKKLIEQTQVLLHSVGIVSKVYLDDCIDRRWGDRDQWRLEITDCYYKSLFKNQIGFISNRKQDALDRLESDRGFLKIEHSVLVSEFAQKILQKMKNGKSFNKCSDPRKWNMMRIRRIGRITQQTALQLACEFGVKCRLVDYLQQGFVFDRLETIEDSTNDIYDISVPYNNTYLANGLISHNTLQHGGSAIIISTPAGIGNWYWQTFDDALKGENDFTPIEIDWWDMDWELEWVDETSGEKRRIAPCDDIEPVEDPDERDLLGPYKSPWLIDQYRALQAKGEAHRFHQEVLARFIGSGNTVLRSRVLTHIRENTDKDFQTVSTVDYANPINGERDVLDFRDQLRVWEQPIRANQCPNCRQIVKPDSGGFFSTMMGAKRVPVCPHCLEQDLDIEVPLVDHIYVMGVDVSSGEANDFSAIQIFDCYKRKQVAELKIKVLPKDLCKMADFLGRYYNNAYMVVERTGIGTPVCQELNLEYCYPNLYRQKAGDGEVYNKKKKYGHVGFPTSATGKPKLIKCLINEVTDEVDEAGDPMGVYIASDRLSSELMTFIYHTEKKIGAEEGNHDDLVMACTLALLGIEEAIAHDMSGMMPMHYDIAPGRRSVKGDLKTQLSRFTDYGGKSVLPPIINSSEGQTSAHDRATIEMMDFMRQMVGGDRQQPEQKDVPAVVSRRHVVQARIKPKAR